MAASSVSSFYRLLPRGFFVVCFVFALESLLKGTPGEDASWHESIQNVQIFPCFIWLFCQVYLDRKHIFVSNFSFLGHSHVGSLSNNIKERTSLACDVVYSAATHARHVHDATDLIKMAVSTAMFS